SRVDSLASWKRRCFIASAKGGRLACADNVAQWHRAPFREVRFREGCNGMDHRPSLAGRSADRRSAEGGQPPGKGSCSAGLKPFANTLENPQLRAKDNQRCSKSNNSCFAFGSV